MCNLSNFSQKDMLCSIFAGYENGFEYTLEGIFRRNTPPMCPDCEVRMLHNEYNTYCKQGRGSIKIGRYVRPSCGKICEAKRSFWKRLKREFFTNYAKDLLDLLLVLPGYITSIKVTQNHMNHADR